MKNCILWHAYSFDAKVGQRRFAAVLSATRCIACCTRQAQLRNDVS